MEMIVLLLIPYPLYDTYVISEDKNHKAVVYLWSDLVFSLMFLRLYFVIRTGLNYGEYSDAFSKKICKSYGFEADFRFTFKCLYILNPE